MAVTAENFVKINGTSYSVLVMSIEESFEVLYTDKTGRTIAVGAPMVLDPLGTFITYKVTFKRKRGYESEYDKLFDFFTTPQTEGYDVEIVHNQETMKFKAYTSSGSRKLKHIDLNTGLVDWEGMEISIIPMEAQITP